MFAKNWPFFFVFLPVLFALGGCGQTPPAVRLANSSREPSMLFEGFHMTSMQGSVREWDFTARAAQVFDAERLARAQDIKIVYWRKGHPVSSMTARRGFLTTDTHDLRAEKQVVMVSEEGVTLRTERLQWDNRRGKLHTDQPVTVERAGSVLTGIGMEADSELKHIEILAHVQIRVKSINSLKAGLDPTPVAQP